MTSLSARLSDKVFAGTEEKFWRFSNHIKASIDPVVMKLSYDGNLMGR
jgi:hypothetical protein